MPAMKFVQPGESFKGLPQHLIQICSEVVGHKVV